MECDPNRDAWPWRLIRPVDVRKTNHLDFRDAWQMASADSFAPVGREANWRPNESARCFPIPKRQKKSS
jgi:hypothetical protein